MEEEDILVQYGLVETEADGQNTPYGGGEVVMEDGAGEEAVVENTPDQDRKRKVEQLEWMECPVCLETPRTGPIFSCRKGHIICKDCQPQVEMNECTALKIII